MPNFRSTYIYLIIALGLLSYILFFDKRIAGTKERQDAETKLFSNLKSDDITGLEVTNDHGTFILQKNNGHWEIKSPITTVADDSVVNEVVDALVFASIQRNIQVTGNSPETIANLKEWGLTPPSERIVIHTATKSYELTLGRKTAIDESVYARNSQDADAPVRVVALTLKGTLDKSLSDFRSRNIFDVSPEAVTRIHFAVNGTSANPAQTYAVELKDKAWHLEKPIVARATDDGIFNIVQKIQIVRAVDFATDNPSNLSPYGLTTPSAVLSVTTHPKDKDEEVVLQIGGPVPFKPDELFAQRLGSNSVFTVVRAALDDVVHAIPNARDLHILPFTPSKVTGLSFSFAGKKGEVKSQNGLWSTVGQLSGDADVGRILDQLNKLGNLQTTPVLKDSVTNLGSYGLDNPQGKITITSSEFDAPLELSIGKHQDKIYFVRNSQEPFIYSIQDTDLDFLPASNLELRDRRAVNVKPETIKSITVIPEDRPPIVLNRSADKLWSVASPTGRTIDMNKAERFSFLACQLQAKSWLGPALPAYKLDKPQLKIQLQTDTGTTTLLIGSTLPDTTHAAQVEGHELAFSISDGDYSALDTSTLLPKPAATPAVTPATNSAPPAPAPAH